jgi:hypothetical protein
LGNTLDSFVTPFAFGLFPLGLKVINNAKKVHQRGGLINKKASSSNRHHRQTGIITKYFVMMHSEDLST